MTLEDFVDVKVRIKPLLYPFITIREKKVVTIVQVDFHPEELGEC